MPGRIEVRAARPAEYPAVLETICAAFGERVRPLMAAMLWGDPTLTAEDVRVAVADGTIASVVRIADRPIRYGGATLRLGGIGAVSTHPEYRGHGLASLVMDDAAQSMRERGFPFAMLFTGIQPFYARLGWTPLTEPGFRLPCSASPVLETGPAEGDVAVRPFDASRDLPAVMRIYDAFNREAHGPYVRPAAYWACAHSRERHIMPSFVAARAGQVVAYASTRPYESALTLYEAACAPGAEDAFGALGGAIVAQASTRGLTAIDGRLPPDHGLRAAFQRIDSGLVEDCAHPGMMLLLLDLPALLQAALPALSGCCRRSGAADESMALGLRVAGQDARLLADRDQLRLDDRPAARMVELPLATFWRLFCGQAPGRGPRDDITASPRELAFLTALFPPHGFVYWWPDHF